MGLREPAKAAAHGGARAGSELDGSQDMELAELALKRHQTLQRAKLKDVNLFGQLDGSKILWVTDCYY